MGRSWAGWPTAAPIPPSTPVGSPPVPSASQPTIGPFTGSVDLVSDRTVPFSGPRPNFATLRDVVQHRNPPISVNPKVGPLDWRLAHPSPDVEAYAGSTSVVPGGTLELHIRSLA